MKIIIMMHCISLGRLSVTFRAIELGVVGEKKQQEKTDLMKYNK